jgi:hemolysin activation/secretion protein
MRTSAVIGDTLSQLLFRVGGPPTVRGYTYGSRTGRSGWSAQLDLTRKRRAISPVLFADVGNTFGTPRPLVGAGAGLSFLGGLFRLDLSKGLSPSTSIRCDVAFRIGA